MEPKDMSEVLRHTMRTTPDIVQERLRPETKALIERANELLAIWQEQEKTCERAWDEQTAAHDVFIEFASRETTAPGEIHAAYKHYRAISDRARAMPTYYDAQREWFDTIKKARSAICEDAGLHRSEEEKKWDSDAK